MQLLELFVIFANIEYPKSQYMLYILVQFILLCYAFVVSYMYKLFVR